MRALVLIAAMSAAISSLAAPPRWSQLPPIPDAEGFAGAFAGVSHDALIVAGGANIEGEKWGATFTKKWYDSAFVLERPNGQWQSGFKLPRAMAYGVSISVDDAMICIGGSDSTRHLREVSRVEWNDHELRETPLPELPRPCANLCGALVGRIIYVAGGIETPTATAALTNFWSLDLDHASKGWSELPPWPGPARMLAVAGVIGSDFLIFSGASLSAGTDGKPVRKYLRDAYRFNPRDGWRRIADLPRTAVAAPSPAIPRGDHELLVVSGDDGKNVDFQPLTEHPGFPRDVLVYDAAADRWTEENGAPFSCATAPVVQWGERFVVPNGEVRPRVRTPEVWALENP